MKPAGIIFLLTAGVAVAGVVACGRSPGLSSSNESPPAEQRIEAGTRIAAGNGATTGGAGEVADIIEQNFDRDVLGAPQPVLVDFYATWCGPCKHMTPIVDEFARKHSAQFRVFKCDIDQNRELANRYGIDAVPTFMVYNNGTLVGRFTGSDTTESFESNIVGSLDPHSHIPSDE